MTSSTVPKIVRARLQTLCGLAMVYTQSSPADHYPIENTQCLV